MKTFTEKEIREAIAKLDAFGMCPECGAKMDYHGHYCHSCGNGVACAMPAPLFWLSKELFGDKDGTDKKCSGNN